MQTRVTGIGNSRTQYFNAFAVLRNIYYCQLKRRMMKNMKNYIKDWVQAIDKILFFSLADSSLYFWNESPSRPLSLSLRGVSRLSWEHMRRVGTGGSDPSLACYGIPLRWARSSTADDLCEAGWVAPHHVLPSQSGRVVRKFPSERFINWHM